MGGKKLQLSGDFMRNKGQYIKNRMMQFFSVLHHEKFAKMTRIRNCEILKWIARILPKLQPNELLVEVVF